jgi:cytochrome c
VRFGLVAAASLLAIGCAAAPPATLEPPAVGGRAIAQRYCSSCHAVGRSDSSRHRGAPKFRELSQMYPVADLEESLVEGIMVGHPDMPEFRFSEQDAASLIAYLQAIQTSQ